MSYTVTDKVVGVRPKIGRYEFVKFIVSENTKSSGRKHLNALGLYERQPERVMHTQCNFYNRDCTQ